MGARRGASTTRQDFPKPAPKGRDAGMNTLFEAANVHYADGEVGATKFASSGARGTACSATLLVGAPDPLSI
jgi:hypothetical protein